MKSLEPAVIISRNSSNMFHGKTCLNIKIRHLLMCLALLLCAIVLSIATHAKPHIVEVSSNFDFDNKLVKAIHDKNHRLVRQLIKDGEDINGTAKFEITPLMAAVSANDLQMVKSLLKRGANIHAKNLAGATALHIAVGIGDKKMVQLLMDRGASVAEENTFYISPLKKAVKQSNIPILLVMLRHEQTKNLKDEIDDIVRTAYFAKDTKVLSLILSLYPAYAEPQHWVEVPNFPSQNEAFEFFAEHMVQSPSGIDLPKAQIVNEEIGGRQNFILRAGPFPDLISAIQASALLRTQRLCYHVYH